MATMQSGMNITTAITPGERKENNKVYFVTHQKTWHNYNDSCSPLH